MRFSYAPHHLIRTTLDSRLFALPFSSSLQLNLELKYVIISRIIRRLNFSGNSRCLLHFCVAHFGGIFNNLISQTLDVRIHLGRYTRYTRYRRGCACARQDCTLTSRYEGESQTYYSFLDLSSHYISSTLAMFVEYFHIQLYITH